MKTNTKSCWNRSTRKNKTNFKVVEGLLFKMEDAQLPKLAQHVILVMSGKVTDIFVVFFFCFVVTPCSL
jgi:hypothetical protein